jgi:hypothetical protein
MKLTYSNFINVCSHPPREILLMASLSNTLTGIFKRIFDIISEEL